MSKGIVPFDYAGLGISADAAARLEFHAAQIEAGHRMTIAVMMQTAKAWSEARAEFSGDREFGRWRAARLPWISGNMAGRYLNVWKQYGNNPEFAPHPGAGQTLQTSATVLRLLAQPAADEIREQVEERLRAGEEITKAEIERLKREVKEEKDARAAAETRAQTEASVRKNAETQFQKLRTEFDSFREFSDGKKQAASRREANLIEDRNMARADAAATRAEMERRVREAVEQAIAEADSRYQATIDRLTREAAEAKAAAAARTAELEDAVSKAAADAERAAKAHADALAAQAMASKQSEFDRLKRETKKAKAELERTEETKERLDRIIKEHRAYLSKINDAEAGAKEQQDLADRIMRMLTDELVTLTEFEHSVQPTAARKLGRAASMCRQMAEALEAFLAPRLADNVITLNP